MKKILLIFLLTVFCGSAYAVDIKIKHFKNPIREELSKQEISVVHDEAERRTANGVYTARVKDDLKEKDPIRLEYNGNFFALEPRYIEWDVESPRLFNRKVLNASAALAVGAKEEAKDSIKKVKYAYGFMGLDVELDATKFRKVTTLDCSKFKVPVGAKYLKISFVLTSDMNWPSDGVIDGRVEIDEDCWLEPAKCWVTGATEEIKITQRLYHVGEDWIYEKEIPVELLKGSISTDLDITFGSASVFYEDETLDSSVIYLPGQPYPIIVNFEGAGGIYTKAGKVSNGVVAWATLGQFSANNASTYNLLDSDALSGNYFVTIYSDGDDSSKTKAAIGGVDSLGALTTGSIYTVSTRSCNFPRIASVGHNEDDEFVACYYSSNVNYMIYGKHNGSYRITLGSEQTLSTSAKSSTDHDVCSHDESSVNFAYIVSGNDDGWLVHGIVGGASIALETPVRFNSTDAIDGLLLASYEDIYMVVVYEDDDDAGDPMYARIVTYDGSFTIGNEYTLMSDCTAIDQRGYLDVATINETTFALIYRTASETGAYQICERDGYTITVGDLVTFTESNTGCSSIFGLTNGIVLTYRDYNNSRYGTSLVGLFPNLFNPFAQQQTWWLRR